MDSMPSAHISQHLTAIHHLFDTIRIRRIRELTVSCHSKYDTLLTIGQNLSGKHKTNHCEAYMPFYQKAGSYCTTTVRYGVPLLYLGTIGA